MSSLDWLYARVFDNARPIWCLDFDYLRELRWCVAEWYVAQVVKLLSHFRQGYDSRCFTVEFLDDGRWSSGRRKETNPRRNVKAGEPRLIHGWNTESERCTLERCHRQCPDLSLP